MTDKKDTAGPGADAMRRLDTPKLEEAIEEFEQIVDRGNVDSLAVEIVDKLIEAGKKELVQREKAMREGLADQLQAMGRGSLAREMRQGVVSLDSILQRVKEDDEPEIAQFIEEAIRDARAH